MAEGLQVHHHWVAVPAVYASSEELGDRGSGF